jgi:hypothetical protein
LRIGAVTAGVEIVECVVSDILCIADYTGTLQTKGCSGIEGQLSASAKGWMVGVAIGVVKGWKAVLVTVK